MRAENMTRATTIAGDMTVASSLWSRFRGLMGRPRASLPPGSGFWFEGTSSIHMLFMRFPIDCVFLSRADEGGVRRVVALRRGLPAWRGIVWYVRGANGLVELPPGAVDACGTQIGDEVRFTG